MPKKKQNRPDPLAEFPANYRYLIDEAGRFESEIETIKQIGFMNIPLETRRHYEGLQAKLSQHPVSDMMAYSDFIKRFPPKRVPETQRIYLLRSHLSIWQSEPILDLLPPDIGYLCEPSRRYNIWSDSDIEDFVYKEATAEDWEVLSECRARYEVGDSHSQLVDQFKEEFPETFYHESKILLNLIFVSHNFP